MDFEEAKERAVKYLVLQLRTKHEVIEKLQKLKVNPKIIDEVIEYLENIGYIDDNKYVDSYLRQSLNIPKYSIAEIKMKLIKKGISKNLIETKLSEFDSVSYEKLIINKLLTTKLKDKDTLNQKAYLYRRGFNLEIIDFSN